MNYGKRNAAAYRVNLMRQYYTLACSGIDAAARKEYRQKFNRMVARDLKFAAAYGFTRLEAIHA